VLRSKVPHDMILDPVISPDEFARCDCGATELWRPVLLADTGARACMACGHVRVVHDEWSYPKNPHLDPEVIATRLLTIDDDVRPWLGAFPRLVASPPADSNEPCWLPASLRVADAQMLLAVECELAAAPPLPRLGDRLRAAGIPAAPPRRDMRWEFTYWLDVHDALLLTDESPLGDVLRLASSQTPLAARIANEQLDCRAGLLDSLLGAFETGTPPRNMVLPALRRLAATAPIEACTAVGSAVANRLSSLLDVPFDNEVEIEEIVLLLLALGPTAAVAIEPLRRLEASELVRCRSLLRDGIEELRAVLAR